MALRRAFPLAPSGRRFSPYDPIVPDNLITREGPIPAQELEPYPVATTLTVDVILSITYQVINLGGDEPCVTVSDCKPLAALGLDAAPLATMEVSPAPEGALTQDGAPVAVLTCKTSR